MAKRVYGNLRSWLDGEGLSQCEAAKRLGMKESYFSLILRGKRQPRLNLATKIAAIANIPIESLMI